MASHAREHGRRRYITDPAYMPPSHRAHLEWTPSRLVDWARSVSPHAAALAEKMLASRPHPEHSYRACLGLMNLAKHYGNERLGAACQRALASGAISYTSVKSILAQNQASVTRLPLATSAGASGRRRSATPCGKARLPASGRKCNTNMPMASVTGRNAIRSALVGYMAMALRSPST